MLVMCYCCKNLNYIKLFMINAIINIIDYLCYLNRNTSLLLCTYKLCTYIIYVKTNNFSYYIQYGMLLL
ncbi:Hypothetical protein ERGA_CDS_08120 [Ehrlichia ruminantium str. Gardel]|nr:Hypothetical protein ERGA_CDS_08120 [Ehrlichia ruminantium str. Gardel]